MPRAAIDSGTWAQRNETVLIMAVSARGEQVYILCLDGLARWVPGTEVRADHPERLGTMGDKESGR